MFDDLPQGEEYTVNARTASVVLREMQRLAQDFPDMFPPFDPSSLPALRVGNGYDTPGLRCQIATILGRLQVAIQDDDAPPVTQHRTFAFVHDPELRQILERDYAEIQRAFIAQCWKAVIILAGSAIEALLVDLLSANSNLALSAASAPKGKAHITQWDFAHLIDVAVEIKLVSAGVDKLSHSVRGYRNLVHPGNEIRHKLKFGGEEARIAVELLHIVHRDLAS